MRTTLELDDELVNQAKVLARKRGVSLGRVISDLAQKSLLADTPPKYRNGARQLESRPDAPQLTMELVNRLRDEE